MLKAKCAHELIKAEETHNDGSAFFKCRHCGKYGDKSSGYSLGGGHRIIIFKNQDVQGMIAQEKAAEIAAQERKAAYADMMQAA